MPSWSGPTNKPTCSSSGRSGGSSGWTSATCCSSNPGPAPATQDLLLALGLPLAEFWGTPETAGLATMPPPGAVRVGSVGTALPATETRIAPDGELLVRGPHLMRGYRGEPGAPR
ncbi:AMP-binding protein [Pseudonocardia sp. NPDC049154]|uniref:AMP-binding protein n=1 Tax=Pseudonocardia sp. NPDC049154 TaxID=3155501 RepID=UPI0033CD17FC